MLVTCTNDDGSLKVFRISFLGKKIISVFKNWFTLENNLLPSRASLGDLVWLGMSQLETIW